MLKDEPAAGLRACKRQAAPSLPQTSGPARPTRNTVCQPRGEPRAGGLGRRRARPELKAAAEPVRSLSPAADSVPDSVPDGGEEMRREGGKDTSMEGGREGGT